MRYIKLIFWIIIGILVVIFSFLNSHTIPIKFFSNAHAIYLPLLLLITLLVGWLLGMILLTPKFFHLKHCKRKLNKRIETLERELFELRSAPLKEV